MDALATTDELIDIPFEWNKKLKASREKTPANKWNARELGLLFDNADQVGKQWSHSRGMTLAERLMEEGKPKGRVKGILEEKRSTLLSVLQLSFRCIPAVIQAEIEATTDIQTLDDWLDTFVKAKKISDIPFQRFKD